MIVEVAFTALNTAIKFGLIMGLWFDMVWVLLGRVV